METYFITVKNHLPIEITKEEFMKAEFHHGFRTKYPGSPATGGFSGGPLVYYSVSYQSEKVMERTNQDVITAIDRHEITYPGTPDNKKQFVLPAAQALDYLLLENEHEVRALKPLELEEPDWAAWYFPLSDDYLYVEAAGKKFIFYIYEFQDWHRKKEVVTFVGHEHEAKLDTKLGTLQRYGTR